MSPCSRPARATAWAAVPEQQERLEVGKGIDPVSQEPADIVFDLVYLPLIVQISDYARFGQNQSGNQPAANRA